MLRRVTEIAFVETHKELWDPCHKDIHRREVQTERWIAVELVYSDFLQHTKRTCGRIAETRWKELKAAYEKHEKRILNAPSGSGIDATKERFLYSDHMKFSSLFSAARQPKISYCFGSSKNAVVVKPKATEIVRTPKRKMFQTEDQKSKFLMKGDSGNDLTEKIVEEMSKTRTAVMKLFDCENSENCFSSNEE
ncbi:hypothetical protein L5515_010527 [Caenorhabditis briggsae]|uniref:MADF domain-containing protein n=1 Tax=Caenorhabditis briggsae TaxID=6238 RepID=A0AAE9EQH3_CAEBR|nr:hypothetical protein L5515_010527 [Caenorhabditis briggsae]